MDSGGRRRKRVTISHLNEEAESGDSHGVVDGCRRVPVESGLDVDNVQLRAESKLDTFARSETRAAKKVSVFLILVVCGTHIPTIVLRGTY